MSDQIDTIEQGLTEQSREALSLLEIDPDFALSKVLFPETDSRTVTLLGKPRDIFPIPIKYSRKLHTLLKPFAEKIDQAMQETKQIVNLNDEAIEALSQIGKLLSEFYKWTDVLAAIDEEGLTVGELQELAVRQQEANGTNDFLLGPLRIVIKVLQITEMAHARFHSLLTTRHYSTIGPALSTSSSPNTPTDSLQSSLQD